MTTNLLFNQQCTRIPFSLHPPQHLFVIVFLMLAILSSVRCYLFIVLICICLIIKNIETLFTCLLDICVFFGEMSIRSSDCFLIALSFFCSFRFFFFISWRLITLQYCSGFLHTLTWISHGYTCIPHPDPPSHLPLQPRWLAISASMAESSMQCLEGVSIKTSC